MTKFEVLGARAFLSADTPSNVQVLAIYRPLLPRNYFSRARAVSLFRSGGPSRPLGGLINIGYNCYVNAVLQVLAYTPGFPEFCLNLPNVMYQHNSSSAFFLDSFGHIFSEISRRRSTSPTWILSDSALLDDQFRLPIQQDAHEYLLHLIDAFQRECMAAMAGPSETMISHFFTCNLTVTLHCTACGATESRDTTSNDLTIPMREYPDLAAAVAAVTSGAKIAIPGQCDACGESGSLTKASHFTQLSLILIVTLMRFDNSLRKIEDWIGFPRTLTVCECAEYELYALIVHDGRMLTHGHFVAFVRDELNVWYKVDDVCVFRVKEEVVLESCPYVLFYKCVNV
jgi:uncharacterized UBP type Zn finger protein